ncbi:hypothetical protein P152DRAFT_454483 [Eremomyces bilateralis CBS 781.70]|uniref:Uncharacterized protein n=1 Tax=Eremomyces bilateralis CBS 781.70 TaxID=1392243 RepID=A0A6G1GED6_9PEZI|nr:uncharacterized protein P152DRAFT_454483 [Eremomyces bilateralis CBS 781.70]KAF1816230.1 hypothetical protein P152DRAFT_454483 [Eremomyces bilateralis CBS 781.70]
MCRNHRIIYSCLHHRDTIKLCPHVVAPLVQGITTFPFNAPSTVTTSPTHDTLMTVDNNPRPCPDCELPDLNIFRLEPVVRVDGTEKPPRDSLTVEVVGPHSGWLTADTNSSNIPAADSRKSGGRRPVPPSTVPHPGARMSTNGKVRVPSKL